MFINFQMQISAVRSEWMDAAWDACPDDAAWVDGFCMFLGI